MVTARFNDLLTLLITRWKVWQDVPRRPELVPELARARFALEDARTAIHAERESVWGPARSTATLTSVSEEDRARLKVFAAGSQQN